MSTLTEAAAPIAILCAFHFTLRGIKALRYGVAKLFWIGAGKITAFLAIP